MPRPKNITPSKRIDFTLSEELYNKLQKEAHNKEINLPALVRVILGEYYARQGKQ